MPNCVVYQQCGKDAGARIRLPEGYTYCLWRPGVFRIVPPGLSWLPFAFYWVMHTFGVFSNRDYSVLMIHCGGELVHCSVVFPGYFRFPFMGAADLQIGNTWTSERQRGRGLACLAIQIILDQDHDPDRNYWYVSEATNMASIRVVEKLGFRKVGNCVRVSRFGLRLLGAFVIAEPI